MALAGAVQGIIISLLTRLFVILTHVRTMKAVHQTLMNAEDATGMKMFV